MIICLRPERAWLEVRMNRRRQVARQPFFGWCFQVRRKLPSLHWVMKDIWAGPLVVRLDHWRDVDA